ncbi:uncharacterized protein CTRU02_203280 [Colletotrichum truncatum]|uniref:Uncharacterized protein n=1 Tax=Colletotrichum truncatum TaxID=5467 RepID=A0ACC3Z8U2_COLTU|nr:uncharacterized protein CTRU02_15542 [Colletotrichum truncatum]KAF6780959.1 hypothetical protein CTRU02_15542 [Colletotrichum truncatum]
MTPINSNTSATESNSRQDDIPNPILPDSMGSYDPRASITSNADASNSPSPATKPQRALAPDLLRGLLMVFMAWDHNTVALNSWPHATSGNEAEADSVVVKNWAWWFAYVLRTLAHLCAPGFTFLLGMGVVYFGRSRAKLGWSSVRMARHFAVRAALLTLVSSAMGLILTMQYWIFNIPLVALAVDYFVVGLLAIGIAYTEPALASVFDRFVVGDDAERTPLLEHPNGQTPSATKPSHKADRLSWHIHNFLILVLSFVTIWWNHWLSPTHGTCGIPAPTPTASDFWRFWFYAVFNPHVLSPFPPLGWLSFAILGVLYARIMIANPAATRKQVYGHVTIGLVFSLLFILTRLFHFGNLSEGCLQTPDQAAHPDTNPYLVSIASFFYVVKYPPDFAFFCFTLAGTFFLLALFTAIPPDFSTKWFKALLIFGTAALFYFVVHILVIMVVGRLLVNLFGHDTGRGSPLDGEVAMGVDNLWIWCLNLAVGLTVMYLSCKRFSVFKMSKSADSAWRFF